MGKMEKHILKFFLIFNLICIYKSNLLGQGQSSIVQNDSLSIMINNDNEVIYPGKPLLMSLVLPGAGQYYNKAPKWKTALFFGAEIVSVFSWNYFRKTAETRRKNYQEFADQNWTLRNWIDNRFYPHSNSDWYDFPALNSLAGTHDIKLIISGALAELEGITGHISSDSLETNENWGFDYADDITVVRDRHFYENIGKYDQFVGGWSDASEEWYAYEKNVGDSTEIVIKTPHKQSYIDDRYEANKMLNYAKYSITVMMFNHVVSGIESVWFSQKKAKNKLKETSYNSRFNLVYDPISPIGVGGITFSINF